MRAAQNIENAAKAQAEYGQSNRRFKGERKIQSNAERKNNRNP